MANLRSAIPDFQLANPLYSGATVTFYTVNPSTGAKTATLATLYAGPTGSTTALNPHPLDGDGKFSRPVYIESAVIGEVSGASVASHETGVIQVRGTWKGDWITGTAYSSSDVVRDSLTDNVYVVADDYESGASVAVDVAAEKLVLMIDLAPITSAAEGYRDEAEQFKNDAEAAAASASNGNFTDTPTALGFARRNAGNTQYETLTPLETNDAISGFGDNISSGSTTDLATTTGRVAYLTGNATINDLGTMAAGVERGLITTGTPTFTHSANLVLPGEVNLTAAVGDYFRFKSLGAGAWKLVGGLRANGQPLFASILLPSATDPLPTVEGDAKWDSDDNILIVGDGSGQKLFLPVPSGLAAGDLLYLSAAKVLSRLAKGTAGQALKMNSGATAPEWGITLIAEDKQNASGSAVNFEDLPIGITRIMIAYSALSTAAGNDIEVQLGDSGGYETTDYASAGSNIGTDDTDPSSSTSGLLLMGDNAAGASISGLMTLLLVDPATNTWSMSSSASMGSGGSNRVYFSGGTKALSAVLDKLRVTTTSTFDAGMVRIAYD